MWRANQRTQQGEREWERERVEECKLEENYRKIHNVRNRREKNETTDLVRFVFNSSRHIQQIR